MQNRLNIDELRNIKLEGIFTDLIPVTEKDTNNIVELRNKGRNKYFLNQQYDITSESQLEWFKKYRERDNDLYLGIYNKNDIFIGTLRIYDIDYEKNLCNQGSFMIDEEYASEAPYAVETEILSLDFIFNELKINNVINEDREDNKIMNNLSKRIGFKFVKNTIINGVNYNYYILTKDEYLKNREKFIGILEAWKNR